MTGFDKSNWAKPEFSRGYRDNADVFIVERRRMLDVLQSFYGHFVKDGSPKNILDLGCGDGIVAAVIADVDPLISATLVDGSRDMLAKAKERLGGRGRARYVHATFQDMLARDIVRGRFDFIASSLAIHHLTMGEKAGLFDNIYRLLNRRGHFVNIDVVRAPSPRLEKWYLSLWQDWIDEQKWSRCIKAGAIGDIIRNYKKADENKPDTLQDQLTALKSSGFQDVDCYYQYGIFSIFGGKKGDVT